MFKKSLETTNVLSGNKQIYKKKGIEKKVTDRIWIINGMDQLVLTLQLCKCVKFWDKNN